MGEDRVTVVNFDRGLCATSAILGRLNDREIAKEIPEFLGSRLDVSLRSVFDGRHHLIVGSDGRKELYDLTADPGESRNLASDAGDLLRSLEPRLPEFP